MDKQTFECACHNDEHEFKFILDLDEPDYKAVYLVTFMADGGFWYRLTRAIKYLFGYKCRFGHFDETVIDNPKDAQRIADLMDVFLTEYSEMSNKYAQANDN